MGLDTNEKNYWQTTTIKHVDAFLRLLSVMVGDRRYQEIIDEMNENANVKEGQTTMCEIYDQILQKGIEQERVHTEEQRRRAEIAEAKLREAEAKLKENGIVI